jgi:hypothetical protein
MSLPASARLLLALTLAAATAAAAATVAAAGATADSSARATAPAEPPVSYGREVRPILSDRCFLCHGPDPSSREEDLRLDEREFARADRGGYAAIVPGDPEASEVWRRVSTADPDERMPPADSHALALDERELATLRRWIEEGAHYEAHWSFVPPQRPALPQPRGAEWARNEVDLFVLAGLEAAGLTPNAEADPATLLRRVFLDLTGLPPTPEEYDAFLSDSRPDAYERVVNRLLTEEPYVSRYAERMATPWLDAARYADTNGIHMDAGRQMWAWRDWVLQAFRDGMPYDRFLTAQLAGDLLPEATLAQKVASGFNRNHVITDEGGAINEEYLVEYAVDRTNTTGAVFLGLTLGCARCHEHKYDPISQEDYFRVFAYFNSNEEPGLYSQLPDANRAFEPFLSVPSERQAADLARLRAERDRVRAELAQPAPEDERGFAEFLVAAPQQAGVRWAAREVVRAEATDGVTLAVQPDGSVLAGGANPAEEEHVVTLRTQETGLRLLLLEALQDPSLPHGRVGRAPNGNAVLSFLEAEAVSIADPSVRAPVRFVWAWADHEQPDADFDVVNVLDSDPARGWAVDAHNVPGGRNALFLAAEPFGFAGGTELRVTLRYRSVYAQHALGRVRLTPGTISESGLAALPVADSRWYGTWPYAPESRYSGYDQSFGPETDPTIDFGKQYAPDGYSWVWVESLADAKLNTVLPAGETVSFAGKRLFAPTARTLDVSLGSDDGVQVFLDGVRVFENRSDRGVAADQDRIQVEVPAGEHSLVLKIVNTGGPAGYYWRQDPPVGELGGALTWALAPAAVRALGADGLAQRVSAAWRTAHSPAYRDGLARAAALAEEQRMLEAAIPRTMVMKELAEQRQTYLLVRGQYDHPDKERPIARGIPAALGALPAGAAADRRGLAAWMTQPDNPLVARVYVNRLWETLFGTGIVATSEDFGLQGDWPSHPELLDWLAVEFRDGGWDVKAMLRRLVTSSTYRQSSRIRPESVERDPELRLLSSYPRRRLGAEEVRDQALALGGLLVESFGGPSVKPYQPEGLWQEVAMLQSNTRVFVRDDGDALWRRSLYTYWKRAVPPPSLMTFDAPTREFCNVRRSITNTPLQALVLWNDVQFVEAARALAQRTLAEVAPSPDGAVGGAAAGARDDDGWRIARMFRRCTGRAPELAETARLRTALDFFARRYADAPEDAAKLLAAGEHPLPPDADPAQLAAWTLLANALLALDEVISQR